MLSWLPQGPEYTWVDALVLATAGALSTAVYLLLVWFAWQFVRPFLTYLCTRWRAR